MKKELFLAIIFIILISSLVYAEDKDLKKININDAANKVLDKDINLPENIQSIINFIFGLKDGENLNFEELVMIVALWIFIFLLILSLINLVPFFEESNRLVSLIVSIIIMLLISISRGLYQGALLILSFANFFAFGSKNRAIAIFVMIIAIFIIGFGFNKLIAILKARIENAEESARTDRLSFWTDILRYKRKIR